jgi:hypothetical protein
MSTALPQVLVNPGGLMIRLIREIIHKAIVKGRKSFIVLSLENRKVRLT